MARLRISMTPDELEAYLREQRTVRLATSGGLGVPHVVPLWFVWHEGVMYLNSTLGNVTVENMITGGVAAGVEDSGEAYDESWFRLTPRSTASWDFRKIPQARARRA